MTQDHWRLWSIAFKVGQQERPDYNENFGPFFLPLAFELIKLLWAATAAAEALPNKRNS